MLDCGLMLDHHAIATVATALDGLILALSEVRPGNGRGHGEAADVDIVRRPRFAGRFERREAVRVILSHITGQVPYFAGQPCSFTRCATHNLPPFAERSGTGEGTALNVQLRRSSVYDSG